MGMTAYKLEWDQEQKWEVGPHEMGPAKMGGKSHKIANNAK